MAVEAKSQWDVHIVAGSMAFEKGDYPAAEHMFRAALKEAEKFGEKDPRLAHTLNNLALACCSQGKHEEAEPLYKRAISIDEVVLGSDDPDLAMDLSNLAAHFRRIGKYDDAEQCYCSSA